MVAGSERERGFEGLEHVHSWRSDSLLICLGLTLWAFQSQAFQPPALERGALWFEAPRVRREPQRTSCPDVSGRFRLGGDLEVIVYNHIKTGW